MTMSRVPSERFPQNWTISKSLIIVFGLVAFLSVTSILFVSLYDSNLIHFRAADEGVWLDPVIKRSEQGLLPSLIKSLAGNEQSLFLARLISLVTMWLAFVILAASLINKNQSASMIAILPISLVLVWLHPQLLLSSCRAPTACFSILALSVCLAAFHQLVDASKLRMGDNCRSGRGHDPLSGTPEATSATSFPTKFPRDAKLTTWALAIGGLLLLSVTSPYGWSLGTALTIAFSLTASAGCRNKLTYFVLPGLLASNFILLFELGRFAPWSVFDNYFSSPVSSRLTSFGLSAIFRIIPFENSFGPILG